MSKFKGALIQKKLEKALINSVNSIQAIKHWFQRRPADRNKYTEV